MPGSDYIEAVLLGIVQGIAEFLPISSSGHLVILQRPLGRLLGTQHAGAEHLHLNVALHLGTLGSILVVYRRDLVRLLANLRLCSAIVVATIPLIVVGLTLKETVESAFDSPLLAGCGLLATAAVLLAGQRLQRSAVPLEEMSWRQAAAIGLFQAAAILPGVSRSGSTIAGGLLAGLARNAAATFSFFIAIPALAGASVLVAKDIWTGPAGVASLSVLGVGAAVSFAVGYLSLRCLLQVIARGKLHWFAYYCASVAAVTIVWQCWEKMALGN